MLPKAWVITLLYAADILDRVLLSWLWNSIKTKAVDDNLGRGFWKS